jgi:DNA polymerase-4
MDAFYASIEQRDNPELRGKPVVVAGAGNRAVVAAASYEARKFGIHSAMPLRDALRRCPSVCRVSPRIDYYSEVSKRVFQIFNEFTPLVEGLSLDEAFLDVTDSISLFGSELEIARLIKSRVSHELNLTVSVGIAPNKLVAKIASDLDKPNGLFHVTNENLRQTLDPLPVSVIPGIGRVTLEQLQRASIQSVGDLRLASDHVLEPVFGRFTQRTRDRAAGIDDRPVTPFREEKSISAEATFEIDITDGRNLHRELLKLCERTANRLRKKQLFAGVLQLKIRDADFRTFSRQKSITPASNSTDVIYGLSQQLLDNWLLEHVGSPVRLLGVGGGKLGTAEQPDLFAERDSDGTSQVDQAVDQIRNRFGALALNRARTLDDV